MPRWIGRAVVLFWSGFLAALVVREVFHQLSGLLVLLLIALFLALAIEPGVNFLERRKWSRGLGTAAILTGTILAFAALIGLAGWLTGCRRAAQQRPVCQRVG
jgi:predicted PurR-regulated permease PerM